MLLQPISLKKRADQVPTTPHREKKTWTAQRIKNGISTVARSATPFENDLVWAKRRGCRRRNSCLLGSSSDAPSSIPSSSESALIAALRPSSVTYTVTVLCGAIWEKAAKANEALNQLINQSNNRSIKQSIKRSIMQSINQSSNPSSDHSFNSWNEYYEIHSSRPNSPQKTSWKYIRKYQLNKRKNLLFFLSKSCSPYCRLDCWAPPHSLWLADRPSNSPNSVHAPSTILHR